MKGEITFVTIKGRRGGDITTPELSFRVPFDEQELIDLSLREEALIGRPVSFDLEGLPGHQTAVRVRRSTEPGRVARSVPGADQT